MLFFWQFPHFVAISWIYRDQYATAGMRMLPVVDPTGRRAGRCAAVAAMAIIPISIVPAAFLPGAGGALYAMTAVSFGFAQLWCALFFALRRDDVAARRLLCASLVHLPTLLFLLLLLPSS